MSPVVLIELIKKGLRLPGKDTKAILIALVFVVFSQNDKMDRHISNNIKFRKETRINNDIQRREIDKTQTGVEFIQRNIVKIESSQKDITDQVITQGEKISALEERTRRANLEK